MTTGSIDIIDQDFMDISGDKVSGSTELARKVCSFFEKHAHSEPNKVQVLGENLYSLFSGMGLVRSTIKELLEALSKGKDAGKSANEIRERIAGQSAKALDKAEWIFREKISLVTISRSSQVEDAILRYSRNVKMVYVLESRPKFEGLSLYKSLVKNGINATLLADAAMSVACMKADVALAGCDSLLGDFTLIHKIGTFPLFTIMHYHSRRNYAIGMGMKEEKDWTMDTYPQMKDHACSELGIEGGNCINRYLELIPGALLDGFISDDGIRQSGSNSVPWDMQ